MKTKKKKQQHNKTSLKKSYKDYEWPRQGGNAEM